MVNASKLHGQQWNLDKLVVSLMLQRYRMTPQQEGCASIYLLGAVLYDTSPGRASLRHFCGHYNIRIYSLDGQNR